jgi:hypothetical protein
MQRKVAISGEFDIKNVFLGTLRHSPSSLERLSAAQGGGKHWY